MPTLQNGKEPVDRDRLAGDSSEQRNAERWIFLKLEEMLNARLTQDKTLHVDGKVRVNVDGYCESPRIFCEVWAHIGPLKGSQSDKVMTDAMKLLYVSRRLGSGRQILVFADELAARPFKTGKTWMASCLKASGIEVMTIPLSRKIRQSVEAAQERQRR